jgi:hypothetical protein
MIESEQLTKAQLYKIAKKYKDVHKKPISKMNKKQLENLVSSLSKNNQHGAGIVDDIKKFGKKVIDKIKEKFFFPPNKLPGGSQKIFDKYKGNKIVSIQVARTPLQGAITKFANWASNGKFDEKLKELGYDNAFHLFMKVKLDNGKTLILEKNERINLDESVPTFTAETKQINVPIQKPILLDEFMEKTRKMLGDHDFFQYSVSNNNCQKFIKSLLEANGLLTDPIEKFIMQDAKELFSALPSWASSFAQFITDTAGKASQLISGQGKRKKRRRIKKTQN